MAAPELSNAEGEWGNMTLIVVAYVVAAAALFWIGMVTFFLGGLFFVILAAVLAGLKLAGIFVWSCRSLAQVAAQSSRCG